MPRSDERFGHVETVFADSFGNIIDVSPGLRVHSDTAFERNILNESKLFKLLAKSTVA